MIPIFKPSMDEKEIKAVAEVLKSGWIGLGPKTKEFEDEFAKYIGSKYAIGVNSCTAALNLSINALNIKNGDEIITTPITFVSTAHAILYAGAKPVFADVQRDTLNIDPDDIKGKVTKKTKAIIPVHYGGHPCDMDEISEIAEEHDLFIIEDAAHACGAEYRGKKAGTLGNLGCFSFHAVKNLATGDGGMITINNEELYKNLLKIRWLGINKDTYQRDMKRGYNWYYEVEHLGFKEHMNDIIASIGLVQLKKLEKMNEKRRRIVKRYNEEFEKLDWLETPIERDYVKSALHNFVIKVKTGDRNELIAYLSENGISAGVHYMPLYMHPIYRRLGIKGDCPVVEEIWKKIVTLPLYPDLTEIEQEKIVDAVKEFGKRFNEQKEV